MSELELVFLLLVQRAGLPEPVRELRFAPPRRWRFDFAWPEHHVAVEIEGGTFVGGRHTRGSGFRADCQKYNRAGLLGWTVLRYDAAMVADGTALRQLQEVLRVLPA